MVFTHGHTEPNLIIDHSNFHNIPHRIYYTLITDLANYTSFLKNLTYANHSNQLS